MYAKTIRRIFCKSSFKISMRFSTSFSAQYFLSVATEKLGKNSDQKVVFAAAFTGL